MRARLFVAFAAATLVSAAAATARADDLADARGLEAALDYDRALAVVDRAIAGGGADPDRLAELHAIGGRVAAGLDRPAIAEQHFAALLALQPDATLPEGTSPKLLAPFAAARARHVTLQLAARVAGGTAEIGVTADSLHLAAGIRVAYVDPAGRRGELAQPGALRVQLPAGATVVELDALDAHGNRIWIAPPATGAAVSPAPSPAPPAGSAAPSAAPLPIYARWPTWAIVGAAALAGAGVCAWRLDAAQNDWNALRNDSTAHDYSQLRAIETRGDDWALATNLGFALAGAAAIAAGVTYLVHPGSPAAHVVAGPGNVGLAVRF